MVQFRNLSGEMKRNQENPSRIIGLPTKFRNMHLLKGAVGWGTTLQVGRSPVRLPAVSLKFFIDIILLAALCPWGRLSL